MVMDDKKDSVQKSNSSRNKPKDAEYSKKYYNKKKDDPDFKKKESERKRKEREELKKDPEKYKKCKELNRLRQEKFRKKKKEEEQNAATGEFKQDKRLTRGEHEKKKQYWREKKREQRQNMSSQKKRRIREYDRNRKKEKASKKAVSSPPEVEKSNSVIESPSQFSKNAVKQKAYRLKKHLQQTPDKFAKVIDHVIQNITPRKRKSLKDIGIDCSPKKKRKADVGVLMKSTIENLKVKRTNDYCIMKRCLAFSMRSLKKARNFRTISQQTGMSYKFLRRYGNSSDNINEVFKRKKRKDAVNDNVEGTVKEYYISSASDIPDTKSVNKKTMEPKKILATPISNLYNNFKENNPNIKISSSQFHKMRPNNIQTSSKSKLFQSKCEYCTNAKLKINVLNEVCSRHSKPECKIKDVYQLVDISMCTKQDGFHMKSCRRRTCHECGTEKLDDHVKAVIHVSGNQTVTWQNWTTTKIPRPGKTPSTRKVCVTKEGTLLELIELLKAEVEELGEHLFLAAWQKIQFQGLTKTPPINSVVMHLDFSENYSSFYQNEISSAHWMKNLVTVHPIVAFYNCRECGESAKPVMDVLVFLSDDNIHDHHSVQEFVKQSVKFLKEDRDVEFNQLYEFTDGCSSQYKSRGPFVDISYGLEDFGFRRERNYFCSCHGKGPSDGAGGVTKTMAKLGVVRGDAIITNAITMFRYLKNKGTRSAKIQNICNHSRREFFLVTNINRNRPKEK